MAHCQVHKLNGWWSTSIHMVSAIPSFLVFTQIHTWHIHLPGYVNTLYVCKSCAVQHHLLTSTVVSGSNSFKDHRTFL